MHSARFLLWSLLFSTVLIGCAEITSFRSQNPEDEDEINLEKQEVQTDYLSKMITIAGTQFSEVQCVGLVVNLKGTGGADPPSIYRSWLLDDMRRRNVRNPNQILDSPNTALVLVRAYIPPVVKKGDTFDVEVALPPNTDATSLRGGWLLECDLTEQAIVPGRAPLKGHRWAKAKGPILVSAGATEDSPAAVLLKRGRVLGGGKAIKERTLGIHLQSEFRSFRNSQRVARRINQRFFGYKHSQRKGLATPKTDEYIQLDMHENYKNNHARFLQVIRQIAFRENSVQERGRIDRLLKSLQYPPTAAISALRLEAIGKNAIPFLKQALESPSLEVRFYAAEALAYLDDDSGVHDLIEAARQERAFRVYAFAALSTIDKPETFYGLRQLINEESVETRYGAVRALWTLDKNDPFIRGENMNDEFTLHVLPSSADPLVHVTRTHKAEIVVFGDDQRLQTPLALAAGSRIMINAKSGSDTVVISRFQVGKEDQIREVSANVAEVIRAVAAMGASYPDVAQMLAEADAQYNLPGRLEVDALPQGGRVYIRPPLGSESSSGSRKRKTRIGGTNLSPNLYPVMRNAEGEVIQEEKANDPSVEESGVTSVTDVRSPDDEDDTRSEKKPGFFKRIFNSDGE